jgi:hypothetical protein
MAIFYALTGQSTFPFIWALIGPCPYYDAILHVAYSAQISGEHMGGFAGKKKSKEYDSESERFPEQLLTRAAAWRAVGAVCQQCSTHSDLLGRRGGRSHVLVPACWAEYGSYCHWLYMCVAGRTVYRPGGILTLPESQPGRGGPLRTVYYAHRTHRATATAVCGLLRAVHGAVHGGTSR